MRVVVEEVEVRGILNLAEDIGYGFFFHIQGQAGILRVSFYGLQHADGTEEIKNKQFHN